jgi:hypothetical protein
VSIRLAIGILLLAMVSCESRNPAAIWAERSARLGMATADGEPSIAGGDVEGLSASDEADVVPTGPDPDSELDSDAELDSESELRRVLSGGVEMAPVATIGQPHHRIDLARARRSGDVEVATNDATLEQQLGPLFDGNTRSLVRTEEVNPLFLTFTFRTPVALRGVRVFPSYSSYDWALQTGPDAEWLVIRDASSQSWSGIELERSVETGTVRVELLRRQRDDFVHVNEIEIWVEPSAP